MKEFCDLTDILKIAVELSALHKTGTTGGRIVVITQGHDPVIVVKGSCYTFHDNFKIFTLVHLQYLTKIYA